MIRVTLACYARAPRMASGALGRKITGSGRKALEVRAGSQLAACAALPPAPAR